jgi:type I restriction enzyme, S subunit
MGESSGLSLADSGRLDKLYITDTDKEISPAGIDNSSAVLHPAGTVILTRDAGVGKSAILATPMAVSQHFMAWRCGTRIYNTYLYYWLQHQKSRFEAIAMGSTIKTIGLSYFKKLTIAVPSLEFQKVAAESMANVESTISRLGIEMAKLRTVKEGLMEDLLTGRVRVTVD